MKIKQKFIIYIFGPFIDFFENSLKISAFFVADIFIILVAIPIFRTKINIKENEIFFAVHNRKTKFKQHRI